MFSFSSSVIAHDILPFSSSINQDSSTLSINNSNSLFRLFWASIASKYACCISFSILFSVALTVIASILPENKHKLKHTIQIKIHIFFIISVSFLFLENKWINVNKAIFTFLIINLFIYFRSYQFNIIIFIW